MSRLYRWHRVGEEIIPAVDQTVLVYSDGKEQHAIGRYVEAASVTTKEPLNEWRTTVGACIFLADGLAPQEITHWRYLDTPDDDEEPEAE